MILYLVFSIIFFFFFNQKKKLNTKFNYAKFKEIFYKYYNYII
jgi:hypothetical protein